MLNPGIVAIDNNRKGVSYYDSNGEKVSNLEIDGISSIRKLDFGNGVVRFGAVRTTSNCLETLLLNFGKEESIVLSKCDVQSPLDHGEMHTVNGITSLVIVENGSLVYVDMEGNKTEKKTKGSFVFKDPKKILQRKFAGQNYLEVNHGDITRLFTEDLQNSVCSTHTARFNAIALGEKGLAIYVLNEDNTLSAYSDDLNCCKNLCDLKSLEFAERISGIKHLALGEHSYLLIGVAEQTDGKKVENGICFFNQSIMGNARTDLASYFYLVGYLDSSKIDIFDDENCLLIREGLMKVNAFNSKFGKVGSFTPYPGFNDKYSLIVGSEAYILEGRGHDLCLTTPRRWGRNKIITKPFGPGGFSADTQNRVRNIESFGSRIFVEFFMEEDKGAIGIYDLNGRELRPKKVIYGHDMKLV